MRIFTVGAVPQASGALLRFPSSIKNDQSIDEEIPGELPQVTFLSSSFVYLQGRYGTDEDDQYTGSIASVNDKRFKATDNDCAEAISTGTSLTKQTKYKCARQIAMSTENKESELH